MSKQQSKRPLGLGVAMDLPWGDRIGFERRSGADGPTTKVARFLERHGPEFTYIIFAFQPRDRCRLHPLDYIPAYDALFALDGAPSVRALHHTLLNLGGCWDAFSPGEVAAFTNTLIDRYHFRWVVEDLGIWSLGGQSLPYPLPPILTDGGLKRAISNVRMWQKLLNAAPLYVEFPGFTEGMSFCVGRDDAFVYFRRLAEETESSVTIDIGHILGYQWLRGRTGAAMYDGIDDLPLEACREVHLSGCSIVNECVRDLHHGVLLTEQLEMLEYILPLCPDVEAITYEDPKYDNQGRLVPKAIPNFQRLVAIVDRWTANHD